VKARLMDGQYHDVDSSEMAFKIAGQMVFKKAAEMAKPVLLEPIMAVEVVTPDDFMGDVMGDLSSRRGPHRGHGGTRQHAGRARHGPAVGHVRLLDDLRSRTQGRATYTMQFDSYQEVPNNIATEIVKRVRGE
jgi:elongation factor G